ncbi:MAG: autotransporter domain-containing protein [Pseudomonas sp.]|uniref:autotransporter family protein n=1 Tax=Pseudomonas sp. TaxID=306 RepID=UPI0025D03DD5|nr:autotransporter domain-containing protein [Pseudomonas sp.]MBW8355015.1 autotransporter domain-containing protein [Pseudomonas sp.]
MRTPLTAPGNWLTRPLISLFLLLVMLSMSSQAMAVAPVITNPASGSTLPTIAVGQSMSITISSVGGTMPLDRWVECDANDPDYDGVTPCLPPGLILDASPGSATTVLHGTPTTAGNYTFSITLNDGNNDGGVATYNLLVTSSATPTLTSVTPNTGSTAGATSVTLTGTNFTGATAVSFGGTAATGYIVNNATTITATTPAHAAGAVNVAVTTPGGSATLTNGYTYAVPAPTVGPVSATVAANSSANPITLSLSGGAATSVAVASAASHGTATASGTSITYTPTAGFSGSDSFTYTATNTSGTSSPATVTITVTPPTLAITPTTLPDGTQGAAYSQTLSATGGTAPYTYAISAGSLPAGLSLNTSTGVISGTPSASGTNNLTVTATDANSATGSRAYSLVINGLAPVANAVSATVAANSSANPITLNITGGAATSVAVASAASHGTASASGTSITYTPTAGFSGADSFTYTATNASGTSSPATVTITVSAPTLVLTPASLGAGTAGSAYSATLSVSGGTAPYSYSISSGSLPAGLSLNTASGLISGTPSTSGTANLTITATDANGATGSQAYSITIAAVAISVPASSQILAAGQSATVDLTQGATGGPFTQAVLGSVTPASAGQARMMGPFSMRFVPSAAFAGTAIVSFSLQNGSGSSASSTITFTIQERSDPTKDAEVIGLLNAQTRAAERFASTQMDNFNRRLEQLHQISCDRNSFNASLRKEGREVPLGEIAKAVQDQLGASANQTEQEKREAAAALKDNCQQDALAFWSDGFVNVGSTHARGARDNSFTTLGLSAGVDYRLSPTAVAGIGFGYGNDRSDIGKNHTRSDADAIGIATYLSLNLAPQVYVDGLLGYNRISFDSRRYITGSADDYARGSRDADQLFASLTASYEYRQGPLSLTPYSRLNASTTRLDAYRESGGGIYGLSYDEQRQQNFTSYLGVRSGYDLMTPIGVVTPKVGLAWGHNFSNSSDYKMRYTDQGDKGTLYRLKPDALDSDFASLDMGVDFNLGRAWQLGVSYKTALGSDERNDTFRLGLNGKF